MSEQINSRDFSKDPGKLWKDEVLGKSFACNVRRMARVMEK